MLGRVLGVDGATFVVILNGAKPLATANCAKDGRFELLLPPDAGNGPFTLRAIEAKPQGVKPRRAEVDEVMLDGPEPVLELK